MTADLSSVPTALAIALTELETFYRRYVVFRSDHQVVAVVLHVAHTHFIDAADSTPYLHVTSPEKRSGKSRLLDVHELVVARPWRAVETSEAAFFRKISQDNPTLLLDEVDAVFKRDAKQYQGLRGMLNAGHRRGTRVPRVAGDGAHRRVEEFEVFGAKVLAGIGDLPDTVADRSIRIELSRRAPGEKVDRFRYREASALARPIHIRLEESTTLMVERLQTAEPVIPAELDDRAADGWEPLLAIADEAGGEWPSRARKAAVALGYAGRAAENESYGIRLLADIRSVFAARDADRLSTNDLITALVEIDTAPWPEWWGRYVPGDLRTAGAKLARMLKPYRVAPRRLRLGADIPRGYFLSDFSDAFGHYLPPQGAEDVSSAAAPPDMEQRNNADRDDLWDEEDQEVAGRPGSDVPSFRHKVVDEKADAKPTGASPFSEEQIGHSLATLDRIASRQIGRQGRRTIGRPQTPWKARVELSQGRRTLEASPALRIEIAARYSTADVVSGSI